MLPSTMAKGSDAVRLVGTVKSWRDRWGFVVSDGVQGDVMVHVRENPSLGGPLRPGEQVEFELGAGKDGAAHAVNATRLSASQEYASSDTGDLLRGTIASFRDGWGLIESPSLAEKLYCGLRDNPRVADLAPGDEVLFRVGLNEKNGKNKAVDTQLMVQEQTNMVGCRTRGTVSKFNDGWGFASSDRFKGTIMLGKKNVQAAGLTMGLAVGMPVEFDVSLASNGKCEAVNISTSYQAPQQPMIMVAGRPGVVYAPPAAYPPPPPMYQYAHAGARDRSRTPRGPIAPVAPMMGAPPPGYVYATKGAPVAPRAPAMVGKGKGGGQPQVASGQRLDGSMAVVKDGWGFVKCPDVAGDVFLGLKDNPQLNGVLPAVGDPLSFEIAVDPKTGRNKALAVAPSMVGIRVRGTVTDVREGGWGFANADGVDGKIMLGQRNCAAAGIQQINVGDVIDFELQRGKKGYEAVNLSWAE